MFAARVPSYRCPAANDGAEVRAARYRACSKGRFRMAQTVASSPAALEASLNKLNSYFDGVLHLEPMWELGSDSGGALNCRVRAGRVVPGKLALRVLLGFQDWRPSALQLVPRALPTGPMGSRTRRVHRSKVSDHALVFESDAGVMPWSERDMVLVAASLSVMLGWEISGGIRQKSVRTQAAQLSAAMKRADKLSNRRPLAKKAVTLDPLTALWQSSSNRPQPTPK